MAVTLGSLSGASYDLLHVISAWAFTGSLRNRSGGLTPLPGEMPEADAHCYLDGVVTRLAHQGFAAAGSVVVDDRPVVEAIAGYTHRTGADLIALTTRGWGPLSRLFRGSVAEEVACSTGVPVLLTRPPRDPAEIPAGP